MVAAIQPEIRLRLERHEAEKFEQVGAAIGMSANDMVKVFVRRTIAAGGLPFDMKATPVNDNRSNAHLMPIFGQPPTLLAEVAANAARTAARGHIEAGRLARAPAPRSVRSAAKR
jgi:antitoxin component of RelBE/YafQ-DinJ toxin-antitoxin module